MNHNTEAMYITKVMQAHGIRRIQRHEPSDLLPYEWFAVELDDSRMVGTGRTVAEAFSAAGQLRRQLTESVAA